MCERWTRDKSKNPFTGRTISQSGMPYKIFKDTCSNSTACDTWFQNTDINPTTGRKIKRNGPMYKRLTLICLHKFVVAQEDTYDRVLTEIRSGKKTGHWIWYIFPQMVGLGTSETSKLYAIKSLDEARAYLSHPVLGPRYVECVAALFESKRSARQIFGSDDVKVHSSITLFYRADPQQRLFLSALNKFFSGRPDNMTDFLLNV